jgi:hypothetical protein
VQEPGFYLLPVGNEPPRLVQALSAEMMKDYILQGRSIKLYKLKLTGGRYYKCRQSDMERFQI